MEYMYGSNCFSNHAPKQHSRTFRFKKGLLLLTKICKFRFYKVKKLLQPNLFNILFGYSKNV